MPESLFASARRCSGADRKVRRRKGLQIKKKSNALRPAAAGFGCNGLPAMLLFAGEYRIPAKLTREGNARNGMRLWPLSGAWFPLLPFLKKRHLFSFSSEAPALPRPKRRAVSGASAATERGGSSAIFRPCRKASRPFSAGLFRSCRKASPCRNLRNGTFCGPLRQRSAWRGAARRCRAGLQTRGSP